MVRMTQLPTLSWVEVFARRLERHGLSGPLAAANVGAAVAAMSGAHAQVMSAAELSVGLRLSGVTRAHVRDALWTEHGLVKTFGPRGTVHLLPVDDLPLWAGALSALPATRSPFAPDARLTAEQTEAVVQAIATALADAELTLDELGEAVVEQAGSWAGDLVMPAFQEMWPRWRQAITTAAGRGVLCFGPSRGRKSTYTSPHRWLPGFQPMPGPVALDVLVGRYLHAYGPATPTQFSRWLAVSPSWARGLFDSLGDQLDEVDVEGASGWVSAGDTAGPSTAPGGLRLLPYFDAYVVGSHPRGRLFPGHAADRALSRGQAGNYPVLVVDGVVAGVWHQRRSGRRVAVTVEAFNRLTVAQRHELEHQVEHVGEILEGNADLTLGRVTVGAHA